MGVSRLNEVTEDSIYTHMNKIDDNESLNQKTNKIITEAIIEIGTYPFKYIPDDSAHFEEHNVSDEEFEIMYKTGKYPEELWLDGEAFITKEDGFYQVSWNNDVTDYSECESIAECKKAVEQCGMFLKVKWLKSTRAKSTEKKIQYEKQLAEYMSLINLDKMKKELAQLGSTDFGKPLVTVTPVEQQWYGKQKSFDIYAHRLMITIDRSAFWKPLTFRDTDAKDPIKEETKEKELLTQIRSIIETSTTSGAFDINSLRLWEGYSVTFNCYRYIVDLTKDARNRITSITA